MPSAINNFRYPAPTDQVRVGADDIRRLANDAAGRIVNPAALRPGYMTFRGSFTTNASGFVDWDTSAGLVSLTSAMAIMESSAATGGTAGQRCSIISITGLVLRIQVRDSTNNLLANTATIVHFLAFGSVPAPAF